MYLATHAAYNGYMATFLVNVPDDLARALDFACLDTGATTDVIVQSALESHLDTLLDDASFFGPTQ